MFFSKRLLIIHLSSINLSLRKWENTRTAIARMSTISSINHLRKRPIRLLGPKDLGRGPLRDTRSNLQPLTSMVLHLKLKDVMAIMQAPTTKMPISIPSWIVSFDRWRVKGRRERRLRQVLHLKNTGWTTYMKMSSSKKRKATIVRPLRER